MVVAMILVIWLDMWIYVFGQSDERTKVHTDHLIEVDLSHPMISIQRLSNTNSAGKDAGSGTGIPPTPQYPTSGIEFHFGLYPVGGPTKPYLVSSPSFSAATHEIHLPRLQSRAAVSSDGTRR
jgi:hypothetical protein